MLVLAGLCDLDIAPDGSSDLLFAVSPVRGGEPQQRTEETPVAHRRHDEDMRVGTLTANTVRTTASAMRLNAPQAGDEFAVGRRSGHG